MQMRIKMGWMVERKGEERKQGGRMEAGEADPTKVIMRGLICSL